MAIKLPLFQKQKEQKLHESVAPERISIELSQKCSKVCWFCYSESTPKGHAGWRTDDVINFVHDCVHHGVKAVSFGGGEPLEYPDVFDVLKALRGVLFRSMTTNGLLLNTQNLQRLSEAAPDKVHVSIHFPERIREVERVLDQVTMLEAKGIRSGINLLVARSNLEAATRATERMHAVGIGNERIVYLPMRGQDTPSPSQMAEVAGSVNFQSMSCLLACKESPRFCSIGYDQTVAWCSYTQARLKFDELTYHALVEALSQLDVEFCGGTT